MGNIEFEEYEVNGITDVSKKTLSSKKHSLLLNDSIVTKQYSTKYKRKRRHTITPFHKEIVKPNGSLITSPLLAPELGDVDGSAAVDTKARATMKDIEEERNKNVINVLSMFCFIQCNDWMMEIYCL